MNDLMRQVAELRVKNTQLMTRVNGDLTQMRNDMLAMEGSLSGFVIFVSDIIKQAGAELCQAQGKLNLFSPRLDPCLL